MLEAYTGILAVLATMAGIMISVSYYPQIYKMYKRKSSADVSLTTYLMVGSSVVIWLLYGFSIRNIPLIITNSVSLFGAIVIVLVYFYYKK